VSTKSCSPALSAAKFEGSTMGPKPSTARAPAVACVAAEMQGADPFPSCRQMAAKFGDSATLDDGLAGGTIPCDGTGAGCGGAGGWTDGGEGVVGAAALPDAFCDETSVGEGVTAAAGAEGGVVVGATAWGWRSPTGGRGSPDDAA
jgi:hypothetical protein